MCKFIYLISFVTLLRVSCQGQVIYYYDNMETVTEQSNTSSYLLRFIERDILKEGFKYCKKDKYYRGSRKEKNVELDKILKTNVFSKMTNATYIYLTRKSCSNNYGGILIEEWEFKNITNASKAFSMVQKFEQNHIYSVIPTYYFWIQFKNKIFYINIEDNKGEHEAYCLRDMLLKEVIKNEKYKTYGFSW